MKNRKEKKTPKVPKHTWRHRDKAAHEHRCRRSKQTKTGEKIGRIKMWTVNPSIRIAMFRLGKCFDARAAPLISFSFLPLSFPILPFTLPYTNAILYLFYIYFPSTSRSFQSQTKEHRYPWEKQKQKHIDIRNAPPNTKYTNKGSYPLRNRQNQEK